MCSKVLSDDYGDTALQWNITTLTKQEARVVYPMDIVMESKYEG